MLPNDVMREALKSLRGLVLTQPKPSPQGLPALWVRRVRERDNSPVPTTEAEYRRHFQKRLAEFTAATTKQISPASLVSAGGLGISVPALQK